MQVTVSPSQLTAQVAPVRMTARIGSSGDVLGPGSATDGQAALFDGPSGRRLRGTATGAVGLALLARSTLTSGSLLLGAGAGAPTELATTTYGRSLLGLADAPAGRSLLGLGAGDSPTFAGLTTTGAISAAITSQIGGGTNPTTYLFIGGAASGTTGGAGLSVTNGGGSVVSLGNRSAIYGGSYDSNAVLSASGSFTISTGGTADSRLAVSSSAPGTAAAGEVRIGGGQINAAGSIITAGGSAADVSDAAVRLNNNRILTWLDASGAYTNCGFVFHDTSNNLCLGAENATMAKLSKSGSTDDTALFLYDVTAGSLKRVTRGAADSAGTGYRLLRVAN